MPRNILKKNRISLSKLVENYFRNITSSESDSQNDDLPPITKELLGIAKFEDEGKSYKELLQEALTKKYLE